MPECPQRKTLGETISLFVQRINTKLCPDSILPPNHPFEIIAKAIAALVHMIVGDVDRRFRSLVIVSEMCCDDLIRIAADEGITANPATKSRGCVTITGAAGAAIPSEISLTGGNGVTYVLDNSANPAIIGADGTATICLESVEPGVDANIDFGTLDTDESYPNIDPDAEIIDGINGGSDVEDCESIRQRLQEKRRGLNACGTEQWYIDQILSFPGVNRVCLESCECSSCGGCCQSGYLTAYPLFDGFANGIPPQSLVDQLQSFIFGGATDAGGGNGSGVAPLGAQGQFLIASPLLTTVVIECVDDPTPAQVDAITAAITDWYATLCVSASYCSSELSAVVKNAAPSLCPCNVRIEGAGIINTPANCPETGQTPCGSLPILDMIDFQ